MKIIKTNQVLFRSTEENVSKYQQMIKKRAYIDTRTKKYDEMFTSSLLATMVSGVWDVNTIEKNAKPSKLSIGLTALTVALFILQSIKELQFSKEYDRSHNHTKNYV